MASFKMATVKQSFDLERSGAYSTLIAVRWWNTAWSTLRIEKLRTWRQKIHIFFFKFLGRGKEKPKN